MTTKIYTGVGSRSTPNDVLSLMRSLAVRLQLENWVLRSGGAQGADQAFETGAAAQKQIYTANDLNPDLHWDIAMTLAAYSHPAWERCSPFVKRLHARNVFQILGPRCDLEDARSKFVVCWTPCGAVTAAETSQRTGGTGTAIRIADTFDVPVFNLARLDHRQRIRDYIGGHHDRVEQETRLDPG